MICPLIQMPSRVDCLRSLDNPLHVSGGKTMAKRSEISETFEKGRGVFRMAPNFVPRRFSVAGRRLRLHPDDYYALGTQRGSIKERWFSSTITAMN